MRAKETAELVALIKERQLRMDVAPEGIADELDSLIAAALPDPRGGNDDFALYVAHYARSAAAHQRGWMDAELTALEHSVLHARRAALPHHGGWTSFRSPRVASAAQDRCRNCSPGSTSKRRAACRIHLFARFGRSRWGCSATSRRRGRFSHRFERSSQIGARSFSSGWQRASWESSWSCSPAIRRPRPSWERKGAVSSSRPASGLSCRLRAAISARRCTRSGTWKRRRLAPRAPPSSAGVTTRSRRRWHGR